MNDRNGRNGARTNGTNGRNGNGNGGRRERVMSRALLDMQSAEDGLHDNPTYEITEEQMATELLRLLPWLKGREQSYDDFKNEVRQMAQRLGLLNKGSPGWRNRYEAKGLAKPEDRQPELSMNSQWAPPTPAQVAAAGQFPSRQRSSAALSIMLGHDAPEQAPAPMTERRRKQVVAELLSNYGTGGRPL
jgi:hypothetical protein